MERRVAQHCATLGFVLVGVWVLLSIYTATVARTAEAQALSHHIKTVLHSRVQEYESCECRDSFGLVLGFRDTDYEEGTLFLHRLLHVEHYGALRHSYSISLQCGSGAAVSHDCIAELDTAIQRVPSADPFVRVIVDPNLKRAVFDAEWGWAVPVRALRSDMERVIGKPSAPACRCAAATRLRLLADSLERAAFSSTSISILRKRALAAMRSFEESVADTSSVRRAVAAARAAQEAQNAEEALPMAHFPFENVIAVFGPLAIPVVIQIVLSLWDLREVRGKHRRSRAGARERSGVQAQQRSEGCADTVLVAKRGQR